MFILCTADTVGVIKPRCMIWEGYVACMEDMRNAHRNLVQKLKWLMERCGLDLSAAEHGPVPGEHSTEHWGSI